MFSDPCCAASRVDVAGTSETHRRTKRRKVYLPFDTTQTGKNFVELSSFALFFSDFSHFLLRHYGFGLMAFT